MSILRNNNKSPRGDVNDVQKLLDEIRKTSEIARKLLEESKTDFNEDKENYYLDSIIKKDNKLNEKISPLGEKHCINTYNHNNTP